MSAQIIRINLLPEGAGRDRYGGKFLQWALTYGRYIIIFTELIVLLAFFSRFKFDQELSDLREIIKHKQAVIASVSEFEKEVRRLQDRLAKINDLDKNHSLYPKAIQDIDGVLPEDVILKSLSFQGNTVMLSAIGYSSSGIQTFLTNLQSSKFFDKIQIGSIGPPTEVTGVLSLDLTMDLALKKD